MRRAKTQVTQGYFLSPQVAFVSHPTEKGVWMLTHGSVLVTPCSDCKAKVGELCIGARGTPHASTHYIRRRAAKPIMKRCTSIPHVVVSKRNPFFIEESDVRTDRHRHVSSAHAALWEVRSG